MTENPAAAASRAKRHGPFAGPRASVTALVQDAGILSIQEFVDELPSIDEFLIADEPWREQLPLPDERVEEPVPWSSSSAALGDDAEHPDFDADGWAIAGWQSYDWHGAASLGIAGSFSGPDHAGWNTTNWDQPARATPPANRWNPRASDDYSPSADEVAGALDRIAQRIRSGELLIDQVIGTPPEAAMAAALAAILRMRG